MREFTASLLTVLILGLPSSCATVSQPENNSRQLAQSAATPEIASFEDQTEDVVGHAERLIEKNEREGAVLDQQWYGFRRFGKYQELFLGAEKVLFYGGLEAEIRSRIEGQYLALQPLADNQDPGDIRLFAGHLPGKKWDYIVIGQNGREVALKTMIRLIYMAKFADEDMRQKHQVRLEAFSKSLRVFMSRVSPRREYLAFFNRHGIRNPDAVLIGFMGESRALLQDLGFTRFEIYSDESLRVTWYNNANGKKVLLISINGNRIFASRAGALMQAIDDISPQSLPLVVFLGSGGSVEQPQMVGKIVAPISVINGDPFAAGRGGALVHMIRNSAAQLLPMRSNHASVESVVVETTNWTKEMSNRQVHTVDQELYFIMDGFNSSSRRTGTELYAGILVTDNVSIDRGSKNATLQHAEEIIEKTAELRKEFFFRVLRNQGILKDATLTDRVHKNS
jgi:hypothetical protein